MIKKLFDYQLLHPTQPSVAKEQVHLVVVAVKKTMRCVSLFRTFHLELIFINCIIANSSTHNLPPSSRFLLSGYSTSENQRNSILGRFYPFQHLKETPLVDPWYMSLKQAEDEAIQSDWMLKYQPPSFTFARPWKRRLFILVDNIVFLFKSSKPTQPAKEHFVLTNDTFVFVTEEFKKGYVIELRKPLMTWYIRCESIQQMRTWLESMKKIVACIKIGYNGRLSNSILSSMTLTDDYRILMPTNSFRQSLPPPVVTPKIRVNRTYSLQHHCRKSFPETADWKTMIPPQLPPPTCKLPPVPSSTNSHSSSSSSVILPPVSE